MYLQENESALLAPPRPPALGVTKTTRVRPRGRVLGKGKASGPENHADRRHPGRVISGGFDPPSLPAVSVFPAGSRLATRN